MIPQWLELVKSFFLNKFEPCERKEVYYEEQEVGHATPTWPMVAVVGLEPTRFVPTHFECAMFTVFIIPPYTLAFIHPTCWHQIASMRIIEGATFLNRKETKENSSSCAIVSHNQTWPTRSSQKLVRPTASTTSAMFDCLVPRYPTFTGICDLALFHQVVGQPNLAVGRFEFGKILRIPHLLQPLLPHFVICISHENPNRRSGGWIVYTLTSHSSVAVQYSPYPLLPIGLWPHFIAIFIDPSIK